VLAAIERTGYSQNTIARALARQRTQSLGLAIGGLANPYFSDVVAAVERAASAAGHTLLLVDTRDDPEQERRMVRALLERRVDGLILAPAGPTVPSLSVPAVLLDRFLDAPLDHVGCENEAPTAELVTHLAGCGYRRIGLVAGLSGISTTAERIAGYRLGLEQAGLPFDAALVAEGGSHRDRAFAATHALLELDDPPTALVSGNNFMTIGILRALRERGLRVPEDMGLVAFDDFEWADLFAPRLTAIAQPTAELGARAVELLLSRLDDPSLEPRRVRLPATFVHRDSCGCPS
jgi:LacI family transcriptional regulator